MEHVSMAQVKENGIETVLCRRITRAALGELDKVKRLIDSACLTTGEDRRSSPFLDTDGNLRAGLVYKAILNTTGSPPSPFADFVWNNRAPPRVQFFAWLLVQQHIQCRAVLARKHVVSDPACELCHHPLEDCNHIIFKCPFSAQAWRALSIDITNGDVSTLWMLPQPTSIPAKHFTSFVLLICWQLWKHRNSVVFERAAPSHARFWSVCKQEAELWSCRLPRNDRAIADLWCQSLPQM
ncbi:unnamed protein product [Urochloa humidicola]